MIETQINIHDNFSVEFKTGFITNNKTENINEFRTNTWIFIPNGLDINRATYTKDQFYKDVKTHLRLITPVYCLTDILKEGRGPFPRLQRAMDELYIDPESEIKTENYVYQIKMFLCIAKSAMRREVENISKLKTENEICNHVDTFTHQIRLLKSEYREIWNMLLKPEVTDKQKEYFLFGDDFLSNISEQYSFLIMRILRNNPVYDKIKGILNAQIEEEIRYRKNRKYLLLKDDDEQHNSLVISQRNILKKFVESDLFLQTVRKKDGAFAEQLYLSIAAGVAMIFATLIAFFATQRFGNFTTDLFVVLVISYVFKDRIKELIRFYSSSALSKKYFDSKLRLSIRKRTIGWLKESFDFIEEIKIPEQILNLRNRTALVEAENQVYDEKVILYRKWVHLSRAEIEKYKEYRLSGINDITRINLLNFVRIMDNPSMPLYLPDGEDGYRILQGTRIYPLYFIVQCESNTDTYYKKYRLLLNREGIKSVQELD